MNINQKQLTLTELQPPPPPPKNPETLAAKVKNLFCFFFCIEKFIF